jgi:integrase
VASKKRPAPGIQPKGPGVWELFAEAGRDPLTGKRVRVSRIYRGSLREAKVERAKLVAEASTGRHTGTKATMDDLCVEWLVELERKNRKPTTIYNYGRRYRHDIQPTMGRTEVRKVTPKMVSDLLLAHQRRGASAGSVGTIHIVLSSMLTQACRWGWRDDNPARWVEKPSRDDVVPIVPTPEEVRALIDAARQSKRPEYARFFLLSATTGLRRGEMCGIRFTDIDQESGVLTVRTGITHVPGRPRIEGSSKNRRMRAVALGPKALQLVEAQRTMMAERASQVGGDLAGDAFVFSDAEDGGVAWRPDSTTQYFTRLRAATDVRPEVKLKHLRKFMETYGQVLGFSLSEVALRAGHDPAVAARFYTGRVAKSDLDLATAVEGLLSSA